MANKYTIEQQRVIDERDKNILVSAAAGSGKTAVLTERIISLITDENNPIDVDHILVLTYTKAAAAEMKERIDGAILEKIELDPGNEYLQKQQMLLQNAQISTIHSFCLFVLHNNFADIGLDPAFRIFDETERKLVLVQVLEEILEKHYEDKTDAAFIKLVESYASDLSEGSLEDMILNIHNFILSLPDPLKWLDEAKKDFELTDLSDFEKLNWWREGSLPIIDYMISQSYNQALKGLNISLSENGPKNSEKGFNDYINLFSSLMNKKDYEDRYRILHGTVISRFSNSPKADTDKKNRAKGIKENLEKSFKLLRDKYYLANINTFISDMSYMKDAAYSLLELVKELYQEFNNKKREKNLIDFTDMEHLSLEILVDKNGKATKAAEEYKQYFSHIMVDEYQDINQVQEAILKSISRDNNYFMVGDVKQSIYKFRQARPEIFIEKYYKFEDQGINTKIDLNKNFRSRKEVLDFVNMVFKSSMNKMTCGIDYDSNASLKLGADYYGGEAFNTYKPEVLLMAKPDKSTLLENGLEADPRVAEALMIANKIDSLIEEKFQIYDKDLKSFRTVSYKDIVILLFSVSSKGEIFQKTLENQGIPVIANRDTGFFASFEIRTVLNYLEVINNPRQDIVLYGTLIGFFGGFGKEEIALVRAKYKFGDLYSSLMACIADNTLSQNEEELNNIRKRLTDFVNKLSVFRHKISYMGIREILEDIIMGTGYINYILALKGGRQRRANLLLLLEKASDFEKTSYHGLFRFVRYIKSLKAKNADSGEAIILDENEDAVRIMTIHKSKGLEYPICFLSASDSDFMQMDSKKPVMTDSDYGLAIEYINPEKRIKRKSFKKTILARRNVISNIAEQMRVLYVALTRAREKLYISGLISCSRKDKEKGKTEEDVFKEKLTMEGDFCDLSIFFTSNYLDIISSAIGNEGLTAPYIKFYTLADLKFRKLEKNIKNQLTKEIIKNFEIDSDKDYKKLIEKRLNFKYSYEHLKMMKSKVSVTELKENRLIESLKKEQTNIEQSNFEEAYEDRGFETLESMLVHKKRTAKKSASQYVPGFAREKQEIGDNVIGSACHKLMELIDFEAFYLLFNGNADALSIENFILKTIKQNHDKGKLSDEYYNILINDEKYHNLSPIKAFMQTDLSLRMQKAAAMGKLKREEAFFIAISANEIKSTYPKEEYSLLQGIIDVYFEENDEIVLIDYKTDNISSLAKDGSWSVTKSKRAVTNEEIEEAFKKRYGIQLELYVRAIEQITQKKVKEKIIYPFELGKKIIF